ncbi:uncharacterized protein ARMOST_19771 [Armillaria ostoyae]|uniref:Uncharacterized protein n=1 Tax=Armillaria ostoyae TaxID=47428 RepID=A0A284S5G9_ARMOS|nr:uncharacterized protein ARMOST_19771 [Armillaria ostoyae]
MAPDPAQVSVVKQQHSQHSCHLKFRYICVWMPWAKCSAQLSTLDAYMALFKAMQGPSIPNYFLPRKRSDGMDFFPPPIKWAQWWLFQQEFNLIAVERYHQCKLLRWLLEDPNKFFKHIQHLVGCTILSIAYGLEVLVENDPYIWLQRCISARWLKFVKIHSKERLADKRGPIFFRLVPWCKCKAKKWQQYSNMMKEMPFKAAKLRIAEGTANPSYTSYSLEKLDQARDTASEEA